MRIIMARFYLPGNALLPNKKAPRSGIIAFISPPESVLADLNNGRCDRTVFRPVLKTMLDCLPTEGFFGYLR